MRADRLISIILLLQTRGNLSARQLAQELGVSERTIYRDIEALSQSGIPVYSIRGPGGGIFLVENYRTSLTGLTNEQLQALLMLNIPQPLVQLGAGEALKTALLKLTASLPYRRAKEDSLTHQRLFLDWESEGSADYSIAFLETIKQGVWKDRRIRLIYKPHFLAVVHQIVDPLGLIARGNDWYLACLHNDHIRAVRIDSIIDAELLDEQFIRPPHFNLAEFWRNWLEHTAANLPIYPAKVRISPSLAKKFPQFMGETAQQAIKPAELTDDEGWITIELNFENLETARSRLLAFGNAVEVLEPEALRLSIADFARQSLSMHANEV
ncbi:MAG: WYL domain-containing protein [Anaerolineales bacterium]|nr:WYL domain-containing protein [Anaerolineales bacterium]